MDNKHLITNPGDVILTAPRAFRDVTLTNFLFLAERKKLDALCDQWFNDHLGTSQLIKPLIPYVLFSAAHYGIPKEPPPTGYLPYNEFSAMLLVVRYEKNRSSWEPKGLCSFFPLFLCDQVFPIVQGRELYGIPKTMGQIELEAPPAHKVPQNIKALLKHPPFANGNDANVTSGLFELKAGESQQEPESLPEFEDFMQVLNSEVELAKAINQPYVNSTIDLQQLLPKWTLPFVSMRQLAAPHNKKEASFMEMAEYPMSLLQFHGGQLLNTPYSLNFSSAKGNEAGRMLGLRNNSTSVLSFKLEGSYRIGEGKTLWSSHSS